MYLQIAAKVANTNEELSGLATAIPLFAKLVWSSSLLQHSLLQLLPIPYLCSNTAKYCYCNTFCKLLISISLLEILFSGFIGVGIQVLPMF